MKIDKVKKPIGQTIWFKIVLTILIFIPSITQISYDPANTTNVIAEVMAHPLVTSIPALLPIAKLLLLVATVIPFCNIKFTNKIFIGYYALILLIVGILQNMANTNSYGFVWLIGNTLVQFVVATYCIHDIAKQKSIFKIQHLNHNRLWVLIPMLLAFLMPYSVNAQGIVKPAFTFGIFLNEAGVTYCMITPVVLGIMIVFSKGIYKPLLSVISYVGFVFGLLNMMTWFAMQNQNWWMGVIHLPLLILSFYGLVISKKEKEILG